MWLLLGSVFFNGGLGYPFKRCEKADIVPCVAGCLLLPVGST